MNNEIFEMADKLKAARDRKDGLKEQLKAAEAEVDGLDLALSDKMAEQEVERFSRNGSTFYLNSRLYASPAAGRKDDLMRTLKDNGYGSLVVETVNANTLASFVKEQKAANEDEVPAWLGRRRYLPGIRSDDWGQKSFAERCSMNTPIQGTAADIIKLSLGRLIKGLPERPWLKPILQIHDELTFIIPEDRLKEAVAFIRSWQALNERFKPAELFGKLANIFADLPTKNIDDNGIFKALVGEDYLTVEKKNKNPFSFQSSARLLFSCNSIPMNYGDKSEGFYRRLIIIRFNRTVPPEKRDPELLEKFRMACATS